MLPNYPHDIESGTHITSVISNSNSTMSYSTNGGSFIKKTLSEVSLNRAYWRLITSMNCELNKRDVLCASGEVLSIGLEC